MSVNPVFEAALEVQGALVADGADYCFIGGIAVQRWGEPRLTRDADLTIMSRFREDERRVDYLLQRFATRREDAREFALRNRVLLLVAANGVPLDIGLGALDFEERCVQRSSLWRLTDGRELRTCSADDLIVHKAFAARDRDWLDVEGILIRQGTKLNVPRILRELRPLVELKEDDSILPRLEQLMRKRGVV
jgi:hypothetical protein